MAGKRKILIGSYGALGDVLCQMGGVKIFAERNPDAKLTFVTVNTLAEQVVRNNDFLGDIIRVSHEEFHPFMEKAEGYDEKIKFKIKFSRAWRWRFNLPRAFAAYTFGIKVNRPYAVLKEKEKSEAEKIIKDMDLDPFIIAGPHKASTDKRKLWPAERWQETLDRLPEPYRIVCVGGADDKKYSGERVVNFYGEPILTVGALLDRCSLYIGVDNGITNFAWALGVPKVVQIYSSVTPRFWTPVPGAEVLYGDVTRIEPAQVLKRAEKLLKRNSEK
ncbi:MAG: glycosyltransferase family 9 protein [bacterium]